MIIQMTRSALGVLGVINSLATFICTLALIYMSVNISYCWWPSSLCSSVCRVDEECTEVLAVEHLNFFNNFILRN